MTMQNGVKDTSVIDLEALLNVDEDETPPSQDPKEATPGATPTPQDPPAKEGETQAFARRLRESTEKAVKEEREALAKRLGKTSYDELLKETETKTFEDKGLDPIAAKEGIRSRCMKRGLKLILVFRSWTITERQKLKSGVLLKWLS